MHGVLDDTEKSFKRFEGLYSVGKTKALKWSDHDWQEQSGGNANKNVFLFYEHKTQSLVKKCLNFLPMEGVRSLKCSW